MKNLIVPLVLLFNISVIKADFLEDLQYGLKSLQEQGGKGIQTAKENPKEVPAWLKQFGEQLVTSVSGVVKNLREHPEVLKAEINKRLGDLKDKLQSLPLAQKDELAKRALELKNNIQNLRFDEIRKNVGDLIHNIRLNVSQLTAGQLEQIRKQPVGERVDEINEDLEHLVEVPFTKPEGTETKDETPKVV